MNHEERTTEADQAAMDKHGITQELKSVYCYEGYKYDRLKDALKYAREGADRDSTAAD